MTKKKICLNEAQSVCSVLDAVQVLGGKWKIVIIYHLRQKELRFGELRKKIPNITQKMLTQQLRELEQDNLILRKVYAEVPPRVEYRLTDLAHELDPVFQGLHIWGQKLQP